MPECSTSSIRCSSKRSMQKILLTAHGEQDSWGSHEFDLARFPDPKGMVDSIHAMNGRVMISVWPKFYVTTEHYKEFDEKGWMYQQAITDSIRDWVGPGYLGSFYDAYDCFSWGQRPP